MTDMKINLDWLPPFQGPPEIAHTSASLQIHFGDENATRLEDDWSKSVQPACRVAAYPLALWIASSWWRLRWEPSPSRIQGTSQDADWRMSHELPAAGFGFIWPRITFASDGEFISVSCHPSPALSNEPVRYLSGFEKPVPASSFESEVDQFIRLVLNRLDATGASQTELRSLWEEVAAERASPEMSDYRSLEARLGFDPDEAPSELLEKFSRLRNTAGRGAADEIATACAGSNASNHFREITDFASKSGIKGSPNPPSIAAVPGLPWQRGRQLAASLRQKLALGAGPISDPVLTDILGVESGTFESPSSVRMPIGLAIQTNGNGSKLFFRKRNRPAMRFEGARYVADYIGSPDDPWHPATDAATARQKMQRSFAAEFLCPIQSIRDYLGNDFFPDAIEDAADHFGVSELAIDSQLVNNHVISRIDFDAASAA